ASPRSAWTARARRPSDVTSATALSAAFESARKWTTMSKPCLASSTAVARPMPLEEPVTSATGAGFSAVMGTVYGALRAAEGGGHAPQRTQRKEDRPRRTSRRCRAWERRRPRQECTAEKKSAPQGRRGRRRDRDGFR